MRDMASLLNSASKNELKLLLVSVEQKLAEKGALTPIRHPGGAVVSVPDATKHLSREELGLATESFAAWRGEANKPMQMRARGRLWIAFALIRFGALRLGEVLSIDDARDFDAEQNIVRVGGSNAREVLLPRECMKEIDTLLNAPMFAGMRGEVLHLDPGYLRRKFYERAKACGLPPDVFNPRVIRHSRAIELLSDGVPIQVVQSYLGQQDLNMTAHYLEFSDKSTHRIMQQYLIRERKMKTSARNSFTGVVTHLVHDSLLVEVEVTTPAGLKVVAVITEESAKTLRLALGSVVTAVVKAPWVILTQAESGFATSARNRFPGRVAEVKTSAIASEVIVELADGTKVCSLVTKESIDKLHIEPGMDMVVMFKAFSVILNAE